jgi:hypothetical protein
VSNFNADNGESQPLIKVTPGEYRVTLRYYNWSDPVELPAVEVDGVEVVPATLIPSGSNDFYRELARRSNLFYLGLHYYIGPLLRYRRLLPSSFVEREYLFTNSSPFIAIRRFGLLDWCSIREIRRCLLTVC